MLRDDRRLTGFETTFTEVGRDSFLERLHAWRSFSTDDQNRWIGSRDDGFEPTRIAGDGRVRVGLWCPCLGLGGAEVWQLALARSVDSAQIAWTGAAVIEGRASINPSIVRELKAMMPVGHGQSAAQALAGVSDLIVTWAVTNVDAILEGLDEPPQVIMACHFPGESPWGPGTEELLRPVVKFVAVSELAVESTPLSIRDQVSVIWNAIDPYRLIVRRDRSTIRASWNVPTEAPVVGFLGRLAPEKDPDAMLRLAAELPEPWHVVIVGDGRERDALSRKIELECWKHVHLVGGDTSVGDVLNGLDALVVPSRYESFGLTLAEGLWAGVPVIATNSGLARLVPGLVREIPVGASGRELNHALMADLADREGTLRRVEFARRFVRDRLTIERFGREWTELLVNQSRKRKGVSV